MGKLTVEISDDVEKELRTFVALDGYRRGKLSKIVEESIRDYISKHKVKVEGDEIEFNLNDLEKDKFYLIDYDGEKYAIQVTSDNKIRLYEVLGVEDKTVEGRNNSGS
ncbi:ribbon-helix-helix domain-containing protein [Acidianus sp. HS-5]|uniref:ribbon-helix-helix domain-containing protein n=1 Tax=Acidianus sp. HS-5 TaxID=2886040 RepID=UPI001F196CD3|nr:ribbon-helix-helix domain-containing protein [Acidianus sp. HS-5]BDC17989.1 hypothetical protein HS5_08790 [Acidianus sp. HS-5]